MLYRSKPDSKGRVHEIRVRSITRPSKTRTFRVAGGKRKFYAVAARSEVREFIVMSDRSVKPTSKSSKEYYTNMAKKDKNTTVTDDDLAELEALEDVEPDEDVTGEDTEETPAPKKKKGKKNKDANVEVETPKKKRGGAAPGESRAAANGKVGSAEIAAAGGTDARTLRMVLRKHQIEKNPETNRYEWDSMKDPTVKKILKLLKDGEADNVKQEGLQRLKDSKAAKDAAEKTAESNGNGGGKKGKKDKKKNKA